MAYIDMDFFQSYSLADFSAEEFPILSERASEIIDTLTFNRIECKGGLSAFPSNVQFSIKKATAAQLETMMAQGGSDVLTGQSSGFSEVRVGNFSYGGGRTGQGASTIPAINGMPISPLVSSYLASTGLMYRGCSNGC